MGFWGWLQAIATGWFVLSILLGVAWVLGGKRIFRKPPAPPRIVNSDQAVTDIVNEMRRRHQNGGL